MSDIILKAFKLNPKITNGLIDFLIENDFIEYVLDKKAEKVQLTKTGKIMLEILDKTEKYNKKQKKLRKKKIKSSKEAVQH